MTLHKVTTPVEDFTGVSAGVAFVNGEAILDDKVDGAALSYFEGAGYGIAKHTGKASDVEKDSTDDIPVGAPNDGWTVAQLKAYAQREAITLTGAGSAKADLLTRIAEAPGKPSDAPGIQGSESGIVPAENGKTVEGETATGGEHAGEGILTTDTGKPLDETGDSANSAPADGKGSTSTK